MPWSRIVSGIIAIAVILGLLILGGWYFSLGFGLLVFLGQLEIFRLCHAKGIMPATKTTLVASQILLIFAKISPVEASPNLADAVLPVAGTIICFYLLFQPKLATIADISASILSLFYGAYLPSFWIRLRTLGGADTHDLPLDGYWPNNGFDLQSLPLGLTVMVMAFCCIWAADIGAYTVGKLFGRTRFSAISPKKTVEGTVFGILASVAIAAIGSQYLNWPSWPLTGLIFGLMIGVSSFLGDLTESMMKRDAGVKDSGQLIPGHGGILDRTDSYVFTAPLVYYFTTLLLPLWPS